MVAHTYPVAISLSIESLVLSTGKRWCIFVCMYVYVLACMYVNVLVYNIIQLFANDSLIWLVCPTVFW